jgi:N-hydroxyarylamine O-acetyltransferase
MAEKVNLNAYFERIGFAGSIAPTLSTLEALAALHPATIPFENLTPLMGEPVLLDQPSLERKLLAEKRGGYCFEHNLLFLRILRDLDYTVRPLLGRGLWTDPANTHKGHAVLLVEINGQSFIADVGHGGLSLTAPLRLRADVEQSTPHDTYRFLNNEGEWTLEARIGEEWRAVYAFRLDPVSDEAIAEANRQISTDPASPMTFELRVSLSPPGRRLKLRDTHFTIQPNGGAAEKRDIASMEALRSVLTTEFGLVLPQTDRLEAALARFVPLPPDTPDEAPV